MKKYVVDFKNLNSEQKVTITDIYADTTEEAIRNAKLEFWWPKNWECIGIDRINEDD